MTPNQLLINESRGEIIILAEKLLTRLPKDGATLVMGSLSPTPDINRALAIQFTRTLVTMTSRAVLLVELTAGSSGGQRGDDEVEVAGLLDVLRGSTSLAQALQPTGLATVEILGRGTDGTDATELLISDSFRSFLQMARAQFPWVLINCHSLLRQDNSTSMILVARADAVVATLKRGQGRGRDVAALNEFCQEVKTDFLGVVLT